MQEAALVDTPRITASGPERWSNRLVALGDEFYTRLAAEPLPHPRWVLASAACAADLGWPRDWADRADWDSLRVLGGHAQWPGMAPLATVFSAHRHGVWAGPLGDESSLWLGEIETPRGPRELQSKGSGRTPHSKPGDGRAGLRSSLREFLAAEALDALGIPSTRGLCVIVSDPPGRPDGGEAAAMLTRVGSSFIHFGHFEHFRDHGDGAALRALADFVIDTHAPECRDARNPAAALLELVAWRTADLVAAWQSVGFCHGALDTDRTSILGLTLEHGRSGFLAAFDPGHVSDPADETGRYAWARQPQVAWWNLRALAHAMMPLIGDEAEARAALQTYQARFPVALGDRLAAKLGLSVPEPEDAALVDDLLRLMADARADFTLTFRRLSTFRPRARARNAELRELFVDRSGFDAWARRYAERLAREESSDAERAARMNRVNPRFVLRDHLAEAAIDAAATGLFEEVRRLHAVLQRPFDEQPEAESYAAIPPARAQHIEVSFSS